MGQVDGKVFKRILVDNGLTINIISWIRFQKVGISFDHIMSPSLQIRAINDALCSTIGSIILHIVVRAKSILTLLHIIEGYITQYNILLGRPWIWEMQCVPSTYHGYFKYIHEGNVHYVF